jgi:hypothetical protein
MDAVLRSGVNWSVNTDSAAKQVRVWQHEWACWILLGLLVWL